MYLLLLYSSLDVSLRNTVYYLYPLPGGMGFSTNEDKGNDDGFKNSASYRGTSSNASGSIDGGDPHSSCIRRNDVCFLRHTHRKGSQEDTWSARRKCEPRH